MITFPAEIERQRNRPLADRLKDYNNWNPLTVTAAVGAAVVATPIVGPYMVALGAMGAFGAAAIAGAEINHSNNAQAVAELSYKAQSEALQIEAARPRYPGGPRYLDGPVIEYPDSD